MLYAHPASKQCKHASASDLRPCPKFPVQSSGIVLVHLERPDNLPHTQTRASPPTTIRQSNPVPAVPSGITNIDARRRRRRRRAVHPPCLWSIFPTFARIFKTHPLPGWDSPRYRSPSFICRYLYIFKNKGFFRRFLSVGHLLRQSFSHHRKQRNPAPSHHHHHHHDPASWTRWKESPRRTERAGVCGWA